MKSRSTDIVFYFRFTQLLIENRHRTVHLINTSHNESAPPDIIKRTEFEVAVEPQELPEDRGHTLEPIGHNRALKLFSTPCKRLEATRCRLQVLYTPRLSCGESLFIVPFTSLEAFSSFRSRLATHAFPLILLHIQSIVMRKLI